MRNYKEEYQRWLDSPALSDAEWKELDAIREDEKEIESRFFAPLEFGTAGLRGTMKVGLHHMNVHVIRWATQAFANVICAEGEEAKERGIAIAHDCRLNREDFAREAACVMAGNGIHVRNGDPIPLGIGRDLFKLGQQSAHQISADEDQALQRLVVRLLPQMLEVVLQPFFQRALVLPVEADLSSLLAQLLHQLLSPVGAVLHVLDEGHGAVLRDVR